MHKLRELNVPEAGTQVYCSGSKGFHVIVPPTLFLATGRAIKQLPGIYMEMARDLYVLGLDFAVYSGGKGRMFRPDNGLRPDGRYRVRITSDELFAMSPEMYVQIVSQPRALGIPGPNGSKAPALAMLFDRARQRVHQKQLLRGTALPIDQLVPYAEEPPACIDMLCKGGTHSGTNFNQAGLQLAAFIARAGVPQYKADSLLSEFATHGTSSKYSTPGSRKVHLQGLVHYSRAKPSVYFSCASMRAHLSSNPCRDCPLNDSNLDGSREDETPAVISRPDGYYAATANGGERKVTTFTMQPVEVFLEQSDSGSAPRRIGTRIDIYSHFEQKGQIYFDEIGWRSKQEFLKQFEGIAGLGFIGNDVDIQKIKISVYAPREEDDVEEVTNVYAAGIYQTKVASNKVYTYVEPGLSINSYGIQGTHMMQGKVAPAPVFRKSNKPEQGDKALEHALRTLMGINAPEVMAQLIGWHCLCHLKAHLMPIYKQFPSINLWGEAGCGKSMTSAVMSFLNGVSYMTDGDPLLVSATTAFPLIHVVSSTTTIPRILEEFNKSQVKKYGIYELTTEVIKAGWNGYPVPRGTLGRGKTSSESRIGASIEDLHVSAPLVVCSEQAPDKPALKQRMIQVHLTRRGRDGRTDFFNETVANQDYLMSFSRALTLMALKTQTDWIETQYVAAQEHVPADINDRSRYSYAMLFVGLDYFHAVAHSLDLDLDEEVGQLRQALVDSININLDDIVQAKRWSEVDGVISHLGEMAQLALQTSPISTMIPGKTFLSLPEKNELILDMRVAFPMYLRHVRSQGATPVFSSLAQLAPLMRNEDYCVTDRRVMPTIARSRTLWVFDLKKLQEKGHDIEMFVEG
ncbi:MAG: hypothetical protein U9Q19_05470 [Pseudomonadota bacterium]|nr:hypothetical protein [Pseudomonadota bacterium]